MKSLRVDEIRAMLPEIDALRPFLERMADTARPDGERRWTASGEMETVGDRLVDVTALERELPAVVESLRSQMEELYRHAAESVRQLSRGEPAEAARSLVMAAELEQSAGRTREAEALASAAIRMTERLADRGDSVMALLAGARIARARGKWRDAETRYREAARVAGAAGDAAVAARAWVGLGNLAIDRGLWSVALDRYDEAERWTGRAGVPLPEGWHLAVNRSIVQRELGRHAEAGAQVARARSLVEPGERDAMAIIDNAEAQILMARGRPAEAEIVYRRALAGAADPDASVTVAANLAEALLAQGRSLEAGQELRRAEQLAVRKGLVGRLPEIYALLGRVAGARGHSDGFVLYERAIAIAREAGLPEVERARVFAAYGAYERARGETESARAGLGEARRIYAALGNEAALGRIEATLRDLEEGET